MSLFSDILGGVLGLGGLGLNQYNQNKQNEFNAKEAEKNRQFQSSEAETARQWQEDFYNQYQSPQAMVHQYEQAGINPVLAVGQGTNTPPAASSAQGSQASATAPSYQNVANIVELVGKMALLKSEIGVNESQAQKNIADAYESERMGLYHNSQMQFNSQTIKESKKRLELINEQTHSEQLKQATEVAKTLLTREEMKLKRNESISVSYDSLKKQFEHDFKQKFGFYPESSVTKAALGAFGEGVRNVEYLGGKVVNGVKKGYNFVRDFLGL